MLHAAMSGTEMAKSAAADGATVTTCDAELVVLIAPGGEADGTYSGCSSPSITASAIADILVRESMALRWMKEKASGSVIA